jgi:hypothetical protein
MLKLTSKTSELQPWPAAAEGSRSVRGVCRRRSIHARFSGAAQLFPSDGQYVDHRLGQVRVSGAARERGRVSGGCNFCSPHASLMLQLQVPRSRPDDRSAPDEVIS